ncbi:MAG: TCP-1/cpn60 chaperonin family protein [Candidatus Micrarchaeota archaeon]|nr:TCP-1/cpn60 chaperonin family protein [Candidatus Micrarchaeota archaeon]
MAENQLGGQQVLLLPEGSTRLLGRDAQRTNIAVGVAVANAIRTTLGPKGMDKMLVSDLGDIVITNDGATILSEMNVEHPVAKILVDVAKTQDKQVGDGTTSVVIIAGGLLKGAGSLIDQDIHPSLIIRGYKMAAQRAMQIARDRSKSITITDDATLQKIAAVSLGSKNVGDEKTKDTLAKLVVKAIKQVMEKSPDGHITVDHDFIKIEKKTGGSVDQTEFINGVLIDKEIANAGMPKSVNNAKIALLDLALEIEKTEIDAKIEITSPEQMTQFLEQEERMLKDMVAKIKKAGATVVMTQKGIDDVAQHYLAKEGIMAARRVKKSDMEKLSRATGGNIVTSLDDLGSKDLGFAGLVEERKISDEQMISIEKCKSPKSVTILVRGGTQQIIDEEERALNDAIGAVRSVVAGGKDGRYVIGAGSIDIDIANGLSAYAEEVGGREQFAIQKFAEAMEERPRTLAENAGMDVLKTLGDLKSAHKKKDGSAYGIDLVNNNIGDMEKQNVIEPLNVELQIISSASEAASTILRIDDMISSRGKSHGGGGMPPGGMPGME